MLYEIYIRFFFCGGGVGFGFSPLLNAIFLIFCLVCFHELFKTGEMEVMFSHSVLFLSASMFTELFNEGKRILDT